MTYVDCNKCRVNAFIEDLCDPAFCSKFAKEGNSDDFTEAIEEVIHCKDCKHYWEEKHFCIHTRLSWERDGFCSDAIKRERKEE